MKHKIIIGIAVAIVVAFVGYSIFSVLVQPQTLLQSNYEHQGIDHEWVNFTYDGMNSTYKLTAMPPAPIGVARDFAVSVYIQKTGQNLTGHYSDSSFYVNRATLKFPDGTSSTSFTLITVNKTLDDLMFNRLGYGVPGNITLQMKILFEPVWDLGIYHISSSVRTVTINIPVEIT